MIAHAYRKLSSRDLMKIVENIIPIAQNLAEKLIELVEEKHIDPKEAREEIKELTKKLSKTFEEHGVTIAYLFGSRARGSYREESDYDIAALFEKEDASIIDEIELGISIAEELGIPADKVDVVALNKADPILIVRVLKEGIPIYTKNFKENGRN